jgi:hypothetical protein
VLASGNPNGVYHRYALRYIELLKREGVTVQERMTVHGQTETEAHAAVGE